jgi:hypothetical protein
MKTVVKIDPNGNELQIEPEGNALTISIGDHEIITSVKLTIEDVDALIDVLNYHKYKKLKP